MIIDDRLLDFLLKQAAENPRLRISFDLRNSGQDQSQRMLNALLPETFVSVHRHRTSSETVILLRGKLDEVLYDENGIECGRYELDCTKGNYGIQIPCGQWHTVIVHEPSVIMESKDGAFEALSNADIIDKIRG